ncbi:hypothetical protein VTN77DRAFT_3335 [Rasamsonia byssochlamydoides]|uniref:uncharacterized protein n=1 Tax=Rasamsonia byssochlamydoides TaxID=89139 RepID=UPI00374338D6
MSENFVHMETRSSWLYGEFHIRLTIFDELLICLRSTAHSQQRSGNDIARIFLLPRHSKKGLHPLSMLLFRLQPRRRVAFDRGPAMGRAIAVDPF